MEVFLAILREMDHPAAADRVRLAAMLAMEPHLLSAHLDEALVADWRRVVGSEASGPAADSGELDEHWGAALRHFRSRGWLEERRGNWQAGTLPANPVPGEWATGRAAVVWDAMRHIGEKADIISLFSEKLGRRRNAEAA
jgi:hypothetical protein